MQHRKMVTDVAGHNEGQGPDGNPITAGGTYPSPFFFCHMAEKCKIRHAESLEF